MKCLFLWALGLTFILGSCGGEREDYRIARDPTWFPLNFIGRETNVLAFSDGVITEVAEVEGFKVSLYPSGWVTLQELLIKGRVEGIMTTIPPTPHFRQLYDFSDVYLYVGPVLVVPASAAVKSLDDMKGKMVGVLSGSAAMVVAARISHVVIVDYMSMPMALAAMAEGELDGVIMERLPALAYVRDLYHGVLKVATPPLTDEGLRLVVVQSRNYDLIDKFNRGLQKIIEDGTYNDLQKKWGLFLDLGPQRN
jgi:polar amino acid transport system substrate-binding protein